MFDVLYEDNHLLIVNKPAELATMGVSADEVSLWTEARDYLKAKYQKPGNVYLGVVSRLDSMVSGAVVFARTSKAAARLNDLFRGREVQKTYWGVVEGRTLPYEGHLTDWVHKDETLARMVVTRSPTSSSKQASLRYQALKTIDAGAFIEIELETGRKHQIRIQFASRGFPIVGDRKYGAKSRFQRGIALHSRRLQFEHPVRHTVIDVVAPLPSYWNSLRGLESFVDEDRRSEGG